MRKIVYRNQFHIDKWNKRKSTWTDKQYSTAKFQYFVSYNDKITPIKDR